MVHKPSTHLVSLCVREGGREGRGLSNIGEVYFSCLMWFHWWNDEHRILLIHTEQTKLIGRRTGKLQLTASASGQSGVWGGAITTGSAKTLKGHMNRQKIWWINGWQLSSDLSSHKQALTAQTCPQQFTLGEQQTSLCSLDDLGLQSDWNPATTTFPNSSHSGLKVNQLSRLQAGKPEAVFFLTRCSCIGNFISLMFDYRIISESAAKIPAYFHVTWCIIYM